MKGIILASHGEMANGILNTCKLFFGEMKQIKAVCIHEGDDPNEYTKKLQEAVNEVNSGDGVIILCDLLFGSPCKCAGSLMSEQIDVIVGTNLPLVMEILSSRENQITNLNNYIEIGKQGIADLKEIMK